MYARPRPGVRVLLIPKLPNASRTRSHVNVDVCANLRSHWSVGHEMQFSGSRLTGVEMRKSSRWDGVEAEVAVEAEAEVAVAVEAEVEAERPSPLSASTGRSWMEDWKKEPFFRIGD